MSKVTFNGYNTAEIAEFTGLPVRMDTEVRNCSKENPEGYDYPCAVIEAAGGSINLSLNQSIDKDLNKVA